MKFYKRITLLLVCLALTLSFFSCSELKKDADSSDPQGSTEVPDGSDAPAEPGSSNDLMTGISPTAVTARTPDERFINSTADFAFKIFKESSASSEENTLVSPLSVLLALAITANGAEGETKAQMEALIGGEIPLQELNEYLKTFAESLYSGEGAKLSVANSIWFRETGFIPNEDFLRTNANYYNASAYKAPFDDSTVRDINGFIEKHTDGMIRDVLDEISPLAAVYLVNALGFEAEWQEKYQPHQVREGIFTSAEGETENVDFLHSAEHTYITCNDAHGFLKYYRGGDYAFAALLPPEGQHVKDYVASLTAADLCEALENHRYRDVIAAIPQFEQRCSMELSEGLKALGMTDLFHEDNADLSALGSSTMGNLYVSRVLHETAISVTPQGTKAGAATVVEVNDAAAAPPEEEPAKVILDRPFLYMLVETNTMTPLFMGVLGDIT